MTTQRTHPHPELATARNSLMEAQGIGRKPACDICDSMNTEQIQGILDAKGDLEKIEAVILSMRPKPEVPVAIEKIDVPAMKRRELRAEKSENK